MCPGASSPYCSGTYTVSNGYRLVAGDTCDPKTGVDHLPTQYRCPGYFGSSAGESVLSADTAEG